MLRVRAARTSLLSLGKSVLRPGTGCIGHLGKWPAVLGRPRSSGEPSRASLLFPKGPETEIATSLGTCRGEPQLHVILAEVSEGPQDTAGPASLGRLLLRVL